MNFFNNIIQRGYCDLDEEEKIKNRKKEKTHSLKSSNSGIKINEINLSARDEQSKIKTIY